MLKHLNTGKPKLLKINSYNKATFESLNVFHAVESVSDGNLENFRLQI